jgi:hypothetical protein
MPVTKHSQTPADSPPPKSRCHVHVAREDTYPLQIHTLHRLVHPLDHLPHTIRHSPHRHCRLDPTRHRVYPAREAEQVEPLGLFADGVLGVDAGAFGVAFLQCLYMSATACRCEYLAADAHRTGCPMGQWDMRQGRTSFNLFFSAVSSLLAFLA